MKSLSMFDKIDLHLGRWFGDEVVCLVGKHHPAVKRGWDAAAWLAVAAIAPMPTHPGASGVIDTQLASLGLVRKMAARCPHFGPIPAMVAGSLPVQILPSPIVFPRMMYYQLWHERTHASVAGRWLRDQIKTAASSLRRTEHDAASAF